MLESKNPAAQAVPTQLLHRSKVDKAQGWTDEGMRVVFASGTVVSVFRQIGLFFSQNFANGFAAGWNYFDTIGGIASGVSRIKKRDKYKKNALYKVRLGWVEITASLLLVTGTTLTLLAQEGAFAASVAPWLLPLGPITWAGCMWLALYIATKDLNRTRHKIGTQALFQDRLERLEKLNSKQPDVNSPVYQRIQNQAIALYKNIQMRSHPDQNTLPTCIQNTNRNPEELNKKATTTEMAIVHHLCNKQHTHMQRRRVALTAWIGAALGTTCFAFMPLLPILLIPGLALTSLASVIKIGELIHHYIHHRLPGKKHYREFVVMAEAFVDSLPLKGGDFDKVDLGTPSIDTLEGSYRTACIMAYLLQCEQQDSRLNPQGFTDYTTSLSNDGRFKGHPKRLKRFLRAARKEYIERYIAGFALERLPAKTKTGDRRQEAKATATTQHTKLATITTHWLSEHDRDVLIHHYLKNHSITANTHSIADEFAETSRPTLQRNTSSTTRLASNLAEAMDYKNTTSQAIANKIAVLENSKCIATLNTYPFDDAAAYKLRILRFGLAASEIAHTKKDANAATQAKQLCDDDYSRLQALHEPGTTVDTLHIHSHGIPVPVNTRGFLQMFKYCKSGANRTFLHHTYSQAMLAYIHRYSRIPQLPGNMIDENTRTDRQAFTNIYADMVASGIAQEHNALYTPAKQATVARPTASSGISIKAWGGNSPVPAASSTSMNPSACLATPGQAADSETKGSAAVHPTSSPGATTP